MLCKLELSRSTNHHNYEGGFGIFHLSTAFKCSRLHTRVCQKVQSKPSHGVEKHNGGSLVLMYKSMDRRLGYVASEGSLLGQSKRSVGVDRCQAVVDLRPTAAMCMSVSVD